MIDEQKVRRETIRWGLLNSLNNAQPYGAFEEALLAIIIAVYQDATKLELRKQLDYLFDRELIALVKQPDGRWHASLSRHGVDIVEYTIDCDPGIARPPKLD